MSSCLKDGFLNLKYSKEKRKKLICPYRFGGLPRIAVVDLLGRHVVDDNLDAVVRHVEGRRTCRALSALCAPYAPLHACDLHMRRSTYL